MVDRVGQTVEICS